MWLISANERIDHGFGIAAALFFVAALTDFLDGYFARRWGITTVLGAFLDTTADKFLVTGDAARPDRGEPGIDMGDSSSS